VCQPLVAPRSKKGLHSRSRMASRSSPKILAKITHKAKSAISLRHQGVGAPTSGLLLFEPHHFCKNFVPGEVCFPLLLRLPLCHSASPRFLSGHTFFTLRLPNPHVPVLIGPLRQIQGVACPAASLSSLPLLHP